MPTITLPRHLFNYAAHAALAEIPDEIGPEWPGLDVADADTWTRLQLELWIVFGTTGSPAIIQLSDTERHCWSVAFDIAAEEPDQLGLPPFSDDDLAIITAALGGERT